MDNLDRLKLLLSGIAALLGGWWGSLTLAVQILLVLQILDVGSGLLAGWYRRELSSRLGVRGLIPKALVWLLIAAIATVTPALGDLAAVTLPVVGQVSPAAGVAFYFSRRRRCHRRHRGVQKPQEPQQPQEGSRERER